MVCSDTFDGGSLNEKFWGRYGWGHQTPGEGGLGRYDPSNVFVKDGAMNLRWKYANGEWTSAGVSSAPGCSGVQGRWEVRAKFPQGQGLSFVFLLWPKNGNWPPEVDFLEGGLGNERVSAFYHDSTARYDAERAMPAADEWHTYGVTMESDRLVYTLDGQPWAEMRPKAGTTTEQMWFGLQTAAIDPNSWAAKYHKGGVFGGVPNAQTPAETSMQIDWVAYYAKH